MHRRLRSLAPVALLLVTACGPFPDDPDTPGPIVAPPAASETGRHDGRPPPAPEREVEATPETGN